MQAGARCIERGARRLARPLRTCRLALLEKAQVLGLQPDPKLEDGLLQFSGKGGAPPKVGTASACS